MIPSCWMILGNADMRPGAKDGFETSLMRVASSGHRKISAMNSAPAADARLVYRVPR